MGIRWELWAVVELHAVATNYEQYLGIARSMASSSQELQVTHKITGST